MPLLRYVFACMLLSLYCQSLFAQPSIHSFTPSSGPAGSLVTITGSNFSSIPSGNIIYFGAVRANVITAATSKLTVTVPAGATYLPLTVTTAKLTAYSAKPFNVTFSKDSLEIIPDLFAPQIDFTSGGTSHDINSADFNNDGLPDLVIANQDAGTISVLKNTTVVNNISFAAKTDYTAGGGTSNIAIADIDGDGLLDIAVTNYQSSTVSIFKNTSSGGSVSFASKVDIISESLPVGIAINDLDGDGMPDIAVACYNARSLCIFKNTTTGGNISFADRKIYQTEDNPAGVAIGDIDGDSKPDIAVANVNAHTVSIYRNNSTDSIVLEPKIDFAAGNFPMNISMADFDGDNLPDIACLNYAGYPGTISILKNQSSIGAISFNPPISQATGSNPYNLSVNDITGDGLPDIAVANAGSNTISVFKNTSSANIISLAPKVDFMCNASPYGVYLGDFNRDGNADIAVANHGSNNVSLLINKVDKTFITSIDPTVGGYGTNVTIKGRNLNGVTALNFGSVPANAFTILSSGTINAIPGLGTSGYVSIISPGGTAASSTFFQYLPAPVITSFSPDSGTTGTQLTIKGDNLYGVRKVTIGGIEAASFFDYSSVQMFVTVGGGASGSIAVTTDGGTVSVPGFRFTGPEISSFSPLSAGKGDTVTIEGKKFKGATQVSFGETSVNFIIVDSTIIKAVIDTGTTGMVKLITPSGTGSLDGFTYLGPSIYNITPDTAGVGKTVTITGKNFSGTTQVYFGGFPAASFSIISSTKITAITGAGNSGSVTVTTAKGAANFAGFVFVPLPHIASLNPLSVAPGGTITITGSNFINTETVSFGNTPALHFTTISPDTIIATVGTGSSGNIAIKTTGGLASIAGFTLLNAPTITSFIPASGAIGSSIVINGTNFSSSANGNIVYFGAVKAVVNAATPTQLIVIVPLGASYEPLTVSSNSLMAYTIKPFMITGTDSSNVFFKSSFELSMLDSVGIYTMGICSKDLNEDGKPDLSFSNANILSVLLNQSNTGKMLFGKKTDYSSVGYGYSAKSVDFDGDGKNDIALLTSGGLALFRNTSISGKTSFATEIDFSAISGPGLYMSTGDFDNDGRTDIAATNFSTNTVSVFRNNSIPGYISFEHSVDFKTGKSPRGISIGDIDGDSKPDIVLVNATSNTVSLYKNESSIGVISFVAKGDYPTSDGPVSVSLGDMDNDGKLDIVLANSNGNNISIYKNLSSNGKLIVGSPVNLPGEVLPSVITVGDLDGDGWLDIVTGTSTSYVSVYKNMGIKNGGMQFADRVNLDYPFASGVSDISIADFDGDKKPDIAVSKYSNYQGAFLLRNKLGEPIIKSVCASGNNSIICNRTGNNYQWQINTGSSFTNLVDNTNYSGTNTVELKMNNLPSSSRTNQYRCIVDGQYSYIFGLTFSNEWTGSYSNLWGNAQNWSCGFVPDENTDVVINYGSVILSSNAIIRSLKINPDVKLTVSTGNTLTINH